MTVIAFKYSHFRMSIRLVCDNVLGKNLKVLFLQQHVQCLLFPEALAHSINQTSAGLQTKSD